MNKKTRINGSKSQQAKTEEKFNKQTDFEKIAKLKN